MVLPPKPFLRLDEVCTRWAVTPRDIADYALAGAITLSVPVVQLRVAIGCYEEIDDDNWQRLPEGYRVLTGTADLFREDVWAIFKEGDQPVSRFAVGGNDYMEVATSNGDNTITVKADELVIRSEEVTRFEQSRTPEENTSPGPERGAMRGAPPRFDWDAFWVEVCRRIHDDGLPATQGALVRDMLDWFSANGAAVPDTSTVKKKLAPLWRLLGRSA